jgi:hypothetical protein
MPRFCTIALDSVRVARDSARARGANARFAHDFPRTALEIARSHRHGARAPDIVKNRAPRAQNRT